LAVPPKAVIAKKRSLRMKQSPSRRGDGVASLAMTTNSKGSLRYILSAAIMVRFGCTAESCHCKKALFANEAISIPARRWRRFARHDHKQ